MAKTTPTAEWNRDACVTYLQTHGLYAGHSRDGIDALRQLVSDHQGGAHLTDELLPEGPARVAAAKAEHKTLQAWAKNGEKPPRPATPNLDAINEAYAARGGKPKTGRRGGTEAAQRGPAVEDGTVAQWIAEYRAANPTATRSAALKAFRASGQSCSQQRFAQLFATAATAA